MHIGRSISARTSRIKKNAFELVTFARVSQLLGTARINKRALEFVNLYPRLGLAYNHILKNASTTTLILLNDFERGVVQNRKAARQRNARLTAVPISELSSLRQYGFLVIVRNPYSRLLSAFLDKFRQEKFIGKYGSFELSPEGFRRFVSWLQMGGLTRNGHWNLQSDRLLMPLAKFDAVIRFENYEAEIKRFLNSRNIETATDTLNKRYSVGSDHGTAATSLLEKYYSPELAEEVYELFKKDFENLSYSKVFPPKLD